MDYKKVSDNELISMINENEEAKDILFQKYNYIIDIVIKKYITMAKTFNIDYNDLYQDALLGFAEAIDSYREDKEAGLPRYITVLVERKLQVSVIKAGRIKNKIMNDSLSLEHTYDFYREPLMYMLSDNNENNPLEEILEQEDLRELISKIEEVLSDSEYEVYSLMISGLKYQEIATLLDREPKQIDNTMQRIRNKIKKILDER